MDSISPCKDLLFLHSLNLAKKLLYFVGTVLKVHLRAHYIFPVTSPVSKTFAYVALVLHAHYAICRYMFTMFTVGFQNSFWQITASFSARRREQLHVVVSNMLLLWCSWFKYRYMKLDLVTVGKFCSHFTHVFGSVFDCVIVYGVSSQPKSTLALKIQR